MDRSGRGMIGFACAYTPLPLIDAAGFTPYRILPVTAAPDHAGVLLHDNICPHVKRVLDRALAKDLPPLAGVVFMNSCEAMRRLADAWRVALPEMPVLVVDLPTTADHAAGSYFTSELKKLWKWLNDLGGTSPGGDAIEVGVSRYNELYAKLDLLRRDLGAGRLAGGRGALQEAVNMSVTLPLAEAALRIDEMYSRAPGSGNVTGVPVYLFGNVLADPASFALFENAGCAVVGDDLCTGLKQIPFIGLDDVADPFEQIAGGLLGRPPCARFLCGSAPGSYATNVADSARLAGARGVIAHVMKFCDPYLSRLPTIRETLRRSSLPMLVLEGDCSARSFGQQRTRVEAFAEMLGGGR